MFKPFKNDHQSMQVGELIVENQTDKIIIYGDIDIKKNQFGLEQAKKLQTLFDDIVTELKATLDTVTHDDSSSVAKNNETGADAQTQKSSIEEVENPFS